MAMIHVGQVIGASLHAPFGHGRAALRIGWLPCLVVVLGQGALVEFGRYASGQSTHSWDLFEGLLFILLEPAELLTQYGWLVAILVCLLALTYAGLANAWLAYVLTGRVTNIRRLVRPGPREVRGIVALIFVVGASVGAMIGIGYLGLMMAIAGNEWFGFIFVVLAMVSTALLVARLLSVFPMIALGQGLSWLAGWRLARGGGWRLSLSLVLAAVFVVILLVVVGAAVEFVILASGTILLFGAPLTLAVQSVSGVVAFMMFLGSMGEAYRQLGGPGIGVSERVLSVFDD